MTRQSLNYLQKQTSTKSLITKHAQTGTILKTKYASLKALQKKLTSGLLNGITQATIQLGCSKQFKISKTSNVSALHSQDWLVMEVDMHTKITVNSQKVSKWLFQAIFCKKFDNFYLSQLSNLYISRYQEFFYLSTVGVNNTKC